MPSQVKRRAIKLGESLVVSLPKGFTKYNEIKEKDRLELIVDGKVVIYPNEAAYEADKENLKAFMKK